MRWAAKHPMREKRASLTLAFSAAWYLFPPPTFFFTCAAGERSAHGGDARGGGAELDVVAEEEAPPLSSSTSLMHAWACSPSYSRLGISTSPARPFSPLALLHFNVQDEFSNWPLLASWELAPRNTSMLVPIRGPDGQLQEWAMVELQGKFESTSGEEAPIDEIGIIQVSPLVRCGGGGDGRCT
jgi:hypothetical protein